LCLHATASGAAAGSAEVKSLAGGAEPLTGRPIPDTSNECIRMTKLFVGNLPFSANESDVRALFEQHGKVDSFAMINDRETGRPRGFGFVEMSSGDATKAMQALNGYQMDGRALKVNEAQAREDAPRRARY
jgi:RNA recognition motif-containing protein